MQTELKDKVAIVTGSYGDIGKAICQKFASYGIKIALLGRDLQKLDAQKARLLENNSAEVIIFNLDVSNFDLYKNAVENIVSQGER